MAFEEALSKARRLQKKGEHAAALQLYQQILQQDPQNRKARKALKALQQNVPKPDPGRLQRDIHTLLAKYESGDLDAALPLAHQLTQRYPGQPLPFNIIGVIHSARGDYQAALPGFSRALQIEPRYGDALANLGTALEHLQRWEEAAEIYQRHLDVAGETAETLLNLGNCLGKLKQRSAALNCFQEVLKLDPASVRARVEIGDSLAYSHRYHEALNWYRETQQFDAQSVPAQMGMARALLHLEQREQAVEALQRCLELSPEYGEAVHLLNAAQDINSDIAPGNYVTSLFDGYAPTFEEHLGEKLGYQGPKELRNLLDATLDDVPQFASMADLGCGTGAGGMVFRDRYETLAGIDLSDGMLAEAKKKGCYGRLLNGDIATVLNESDDKYALFVCADTVVYIGNLSPLAEAIAGAAAPGAVLCLSTEDWDGEGFKLLPTGRYAHNHDYVLAAFNTCGFELLAFRQAPLRKEQQGWLEGGFYIFRHKP